MNREIKFKAKRKNGKSWVYGHLAIANGKNVFLTMVSDIIPSTLCEYTGLKDSSGKDIYEGDVLRQGKYDYGVVFFEGGFCVRDENGEIYDISYVTANRRSCYIVGNVHDALKREEE